MNVANRPLTRALIHDTIWKAAAQKAEKDPKDLRPEDRFLHELGFDSLDVAEFAMELEEELAITLPDKMVDNPELSLGAFEEALCAMHVA